MKKQLTKTLLRLLALLSLEVVVVGLLLLGCMVLFAYMAREVFLQQDNRLDAAVFRFAQRHTSPPMTSLMRFFSFFASANYLVVVPTLLVLVFAWFKNLRWYSIKVLIIAFTSTMLNQLMKNTFERPRPETAMLELTGLSFPSGHAMIGGSFYGLLIYIIWQTVPHPVRRWLYSILLSLLLLLIGYSRIYLNVHYTTDVLAGYAMGIIWLIISLFLLHKLEKAYNSKFGHKDVGVEKMP